MLEGLIALPIGIIYVANARLARDMIEALRVPIAQGPAWKKVRLEVLVICAVLAAVGLLLLFAPWPQSSAPLPRALGIGLILAGGVVAASRPWNFMRRMEMQLLAHKERLQGQMSEIRKRVDSELEEMGREGRT